ncbi:hypothetical protein [Psychromarinibacter halotolerans]|uniref:Uncharacterized protein n=1 Tax=Psychromarinibacter halotolerans TaxID=1775175 RepID=A0ABV7GR53_9RHOB|nr:hypothetical protein [Psychromarinibacter halotolerans]MDF0595511.1 hypothetical protein [Psychromarinibacter halotolerans]
MRRAARAILTILLLASLIGTGYSTYRLATGWPSSLLVAHAEDRIGAALERALAKAATPDAFETRLATLLSEEPRNWLAVDALLELADERAIAISPAITEQIETARDHDSGYWQRTKACGACAIDPTTCTPGQLLACRVALDVTPFGDIVSLVRGATQYVTGGEVDTLDLGLAAVGLGATALALATGGSSMVIKGGATLLKVAKSAGRLPPALARALRRAFREGIDWPKVSAVRGFDDFGGVFRPRAMRPVTGALTDVNELRDSVGLAATLHMLPKAETLGDLSAYSRISRVAGQRTVGAFELLGNNRFVRLAMRWSDEVWWAISAVFAALVSLVGLLWSILSRACLTTLRRMARKPSQSA